MTSFSQSLSNKEIKYLRFLNNTLQIEELRKDVCDEFTRKIFNYLESEPLFDPHVFCAFLYKVIFKCKLIKPAVERSKNPVDDWRLQRFSGEMLTFFNLFTVNFALSSIDPNQFYGMGLEEKLKHILADDTSRLKTASVKIVLPEVGGNAGIVPYVDLEFKLPRLSTEQKLDVIHFTICALNYLSQKDEPEQTFSNPMFPSVVYVSKPSYLTFVSDELNKVRKYVIKNALNEKEIFEDDLEFDESLPDIKRILQAQNQDSRIEKQWLDITSTVFSKPEVEIDTEKAKKTRSYPPHYLKQIIDTAVRLYEKKDKVMAIDIYTELHIEKNTYNSRIKYFGYDTPMILEKAREIVRAKKDGKQ
jgi:hypothetical protein